MPQCLWSELPFKTGRETGSAVFGAVPSNSRVVAAAVSSRGTSSPIGRHCLPPSTAKNRARERERPGIVFFTSSPVIVWTLFVARSRDPFFCACMQIEIFAQPARPLSCYSQRDGSVGARPSRSILSERRRRVRAALREWRALKKGSSGSGSARPARSPEWLCAWPIMRSASSALFSLGFDVRFFHVCAGRRFFTRRLENETDRCRTEGKKLGDSVNRGARLA